MSSRPVAVLREVSKTYPGAERPVLGAVSLAIMEGEYVAIRGPSGSGKSTLLNVLGCLDVPTRGAYELFGMDVSQLSRSALADVRNQRIGFVFQSFHLLPRLTAYQNVELPLLYAGLPSRERRRRIESRLEALGLGAKMGRLPTQLSGGEQQRVAIARALATEPALLLADEPTGNLDRATGLDVLSIFESLHQAGQTLVLVTHDAEVAQRARRCIEIRDGDVTRDEPTSREAVG